LSPFDTIPHPGSPAGGFSACHSDRRISNFAERAKAVYQAVIGARREIPGAIRDTTGVALGNLVDGILPGLGLLVATLVATAAIGAAAGAALGALAGGGGSNSESPTRSSSPAEPKTSPPSRKPRDSQKLLAPAPSERRKLLPAGSSEALQCSPNLGDTDAATRGSVPVTAEAFHYTFSRLVASIESVGLRQGSYATTAGDLSPLQAQIDLALRPNRGLPDTILRIDLKGMREAGYDIPQITPVERSFNMPGGGYEMKFPYPIPPQFISVIK